MVVREASTPEITRPSAGIFDGKVTVFVTLKKRFGLLLRKEGSSG
jgi:hypothetical protein